MTSFKILFSTGQGRLHLFQSAIAVKKKGIAIEIITGWIPSVLLSEAALNFLGTFVGRSNNLAAGLRKRSPVELSREETIGCGTAEFFLQFLYKLSSWHLLARSKSSYLGWRFFGWQSKFYLRNAQIFHVRSGAGCSGAIERAKKMGMHVVVDHSIAHPKEMELQLKKIDKDVIDKFVDSSPPNAFWDLVLDDCLKADILVVNSEYVRWSFLQEGFDPKKIRVIQLGVNDDFRILDKEYSHNGMLKLIFSGSFAKRKGSLIIIKAIEVLLKLGFNFSLDIVGNTGDTVIPQWLIDCERVRFHGHLSQPELNELLNSSDLYIFPTYTEGCAQSVKEAMAVGMAVVTTKQCGSPIIHGENGYIIMDDSFTELVDAVLELSENPALRLRLGKNAFETVKSGHTWDNYGHEMLKVYKELMGT
jgi:glycosyltransferase involved in cell wall biosynthesis